ncbi:MAG: 30S ribosomal protein S8 [Candidatus Verstraetearchaeota archaeon]|uniref:Small ribosomal subunit protein uS8 n=1 Tax=Thermoproteota archaeon TaxID=2056631 RepID=A0A523BFP0_9CREN|nr:30S ribosomal protein S8 [Candidatus Methanomethylicia archaeon]NHV60446.1 30S ribosomal protein S8 [Candidatus Verstraetearchaeota archaeon]TDA39758.1 MAG: 30S ribosomal protein S8 [Candidatus Verstraetearchaeota archaeon]
MWVQDPLANVLINIMNSEERGRSECIVTPAPKLVANVLRVLQRHGYIGEFEFIDDGRLGKLRIQLLGRVNKCGVIKPYFSVSYKEIDNYVYQYLPAKDIGILILTTPKGILTHREAISNKIGGRLLAYVY